MKNIYTSIVFLLACHSFSQTQLTLTKAGQEPVVGDVHNTQGYDSVGTIPKSMGTNQNWNFTSVTQNTNTTSETFVAPASVPSSSLFPGTTIVSSDGAGYYIFFKTPASPTAQFVEIGQLDTSNPPASGISYSSSPLVIYNWPIAPGNTYTNSYFGNDIGDPGSTVGTSTTTSSGSGTITMPNGAVYANIVQLKSVHREISTITFSNVTSTYTVSETDYQYFHVTQKFAILTVSYFSFDDGTNSFSDYSIDVNSSITVGLKDQQLTKLFSLYPNPAKDKVKLELDNLNNAPCSIMIYDVTGRNVLNKELGNAEKINETIDLSQLEKGIYELKTISGKQSQSKQLIVE